LRVKLSWHNDDIFSVTNVTEVKFGTKAA
jgi:hypothetical protein